LAGERAFDAEDGHAEGDEGDTQTRCRLGRPRSAGDIKEKQATMADGVMGMVAVPLSDDIGQQGVIVRIARPARPCFLFPDRAPPTLPSAIGPPP
jgi:hypothetical protein